ncbi:hypothetical protein V3C99_015238, partial [Haemonchus contortus]
MSFSIATLKSLGEMALPAPPLDCRMVKTWSLRCRRVHEASLCMLNRNTLVAQGFNYCFCLDSFKDLPQIDG